jgi:hypothetical protein
MVVLSWSAEQEPDPQDDTDKEPHYDSDLHFATLGQLIEVLDRTNQGNLSKLKSLAKQQQH